MSTIGRRIHTGCGMSTDVSLSSSAQSNAQGAALVICKTSNRLNYSDELEDATCLLKDQLRLSVSCVIKVCKKSPDLITIFCQVMELLHRELDHRKRCVS